MSEAMADYSAEAARCTKIVNVTTKQAITPDSFDDRNQWHMQYHYARNHPTEFERVFPPRVERSESDLSEEEFYTESELKALSLTKLFVISDSRGLSQESSKPKIIKAILASQGAAVEAAKDTPE